MLALSSFLSAPAYAQGLLWAKRAGGNGFAVSQAISVDSAGNSYVTGYFTNSVTLGPGEGNQTQFTASGSASDIFVAKFNASGALLWARQAGGASADLGYGIAVDAVGNCYVVGSFTTSATFSGVPLTSAGGVDAFVAKYNSSGTLQWVKRAGGSGSTDEGRGIVLDGSGNVLVTGYFFGTATFGPTETNQTVLTSAGQHDVFVAQFLASTGALTWAQRAGGIGADQGLGVGVDAAGNSYVTGYFQNSATFGPSQPNSTLLASGGSDDLFLAKYDPTGNLAWAKRSGGASSDAAYGVVVDSAGNSYLTGNFTSSATFGPGDQTATVLNATSSSIDIFIARFNTSGVLSWARRAGGPEGDYGVAITLDGSGNSYITGQFRGTASFGTGGNLVNLATAGVEDVFVAKYDVSGILQWARRDGGAFVETGRGIDVQGSPNNIHATGNFSGTSTFGAGETNQTVLNGTGFYDVFLAKYKDTPGTSNAAARIGVFNNGQWRLDSNGNGAPDDAIFSFNAAGATRITGDWDGDGRDEIGLFVNGFWYLDYNGNGTWDGAVTDRQYQFGFAGVTPFVGDWNGSGTDKVGIYINGFWYLDVDGDGVWDGPGIDSATEFGWNGVTPFVADWNGDGRDKIGIYINGFWFVDYNGNTVWDGAVTDRSAHYGFNGVTPIVGDWNGDGKESIGIYINGFWYLDYNGSFAWDGPGLDRQTEFGFTGVTPIIGDWSGNGSDKIGIFVNGIFYLDVDGSLVYDGGVVDKGYVYGQASDTPTIGVW